MIPTDGTCEAIDTWRIREGAFDTTRLDGLCIALILRWPNPIHRGNGRCVVFIDDRANDAQRESLSEIGTGKAGEGGPFEIFAKTYAEPAAVRFGRFRYERDGRRGLVELDDVARVRVGPILGDLDQSEADVHVVLPSGFIYRDGRLVNTDNCEVMFPDWQFQYVNSNAIFAEVEYNV